MDEIIRNSIKNKKLLKKFNYIIGCPYGTRVIHTQTKEDFKACKICDDDRNCNFSHDFVPEDID